MLESFFKYPKVLARMRVGPLADEIDAVADDLARVGYARVTVRCYLSLIASFSRYAAKAGCTEPESIDRALVQRFLGEGPTSAGVRSLARTALSHTIRHLARRYPCISAQSRDDDPDTGLLTAFDGHLREVRGLVHRSREEILRLARRMVSWYRDQNPTRPLSMLCGEDVLAFVPHALSGCVADGTRSATVSYVRSFLRYLHWEGIVQENLAHVVPRVPCWRLSRIPDHLSWSEVRAVIDAIDTTDPIGKRDHALLLLLATTGLRSQEVRRLELGDVRWRRSELHIRRTKSRRERVVPLLEEPGRALAEYVLHGRPRVGDATIFLRHVPPVGPLGGSGTMAEIVRRRLARCGIRPKRAGAHLFRHSLATRMVQQGRPVKEVADLLGHRRIDTTAVYVKVALPQLEDVALPFPGGDA